MTLSRHGDPSQPSAGNMRAHDRPTPIIGKQASRADRQTSQVQADSRAETQGDQTRADIMLIRILGEEHYALLDSTHPRSIVSERVARRGMRWDIHTSTET
jgi:hypothetical protein